MHERPTTTPGAAWAAAVLAALAILSPWPFGSVLPAAARAITLVASVAALAGLARHRHSSVLAAPGPALVLLAAWSLGLVQLAPLPASVHRGLAPGSAAVWLAATPPAAAVLGTGAHPVSLSPEATLRWLAFSAGVGVLALVAAAGLRSRRTLQWTAVAAVAGAFAVAVYGLVARGMFGSRLFGLLEVPTVAPFGPFVSKNHFAGYVAMGACLAAGLATGLADEARRGPGWLSWIDSRRAWTVVAAAGGALVMIVAVPASLSRGGVVALAAGLTSFGLMRIRNPAGLSARDRERRQPRAGARALVLATATVLLAAAVVAVLPHEARARVGAIGALDHAGSYRLGVWRDTLRLVASSPVLGSGLGAFADALPRFKTGAGELRVEHAENDYLELLAEAGLAGTALALLGAAGLLRCAWRRLRAEPHRQAQALRAGALAGLVALLVHSALDFELRIPSNALIAALLMACALAPVSASPEDHAGRPEPPVAAPGRGRLAALAAALAALLALGVAIACSWSEPRVHAGALRRAADGASLRRTQVEDELVAHLRRRPADAAAWIALGWLRLREQPADAAALARWGMALDPRHAAVQREGSRIVEAATSGRHEP